MIVIECAQGSEDWHRARAGVVTASMFRVARQRVGELTEQQAKYVAAILSGAGEAQAKIDAGYKSAPSSDAIRRALAGEDVGDFSETAKNYAFQIAVERISGEPLKEGYETWEMRRGHEMEPEARMEHELQTGLVVQRAGFVTTDDGVFGASADGLIEEDGGSEYKCLVSGASLRPILVDGDVSDYMDQVQGCLWLTGRRWWDFCVYCPALRPVGLHLVRRRFERDDDYIERLEADLVRFSRLVSSYESTLRLAA